MPRMTCACGVECDDGNKQRKRCPTCADKHHRQQIRDYYYANRDPNVVPHKRPRGAVT